jgi:L-ribulokinase
VFLQIYADVIGQPMLVAGSSQAPALGAAIAAAVTAGEHESWTAAQRKMTSIKERQFLPDPHAHGVYNELFAIYRELHDEFGGVTNADLGSVMKRLLAIRGRVAQ